MFQRVLSFCTIMCLCGAPQALAQWTDTPSPVSQSEDSWTRNDVLTGGLGLAPVQAVVGLALELGRFRYETFQWSAFRLVAGGIPYDDQAMNMVASVGLFGVGAHAGLSKDRQHEVGFLVFPLSASLGSAHSDKFSGEGSYGTYTRRKEESVLGFGNVQLYYRWNLPGLHLEVSLDTSLLWQNQSAYTWSCSWSTSGGILFCPDMDPEYERMKTREDQTWFGGLPPLALSVGVGF